MPAYTSMHTHTHTHTHTHMLTDQMHASHTHTHSLTSLCALCSLCEWCDQSAPLWDNVQSHDCLATQYPEMAHTWSFQCLEYCAQHTHTHTHMCQSSNARLQGSTQPWNTHLFVSVSIIMGNTMLHRNMRQNARTRLPSTAQQWPQIKVTHYYIILQQ